VEQQVDSREKKWIPGAYFLASSEGNEENREVLRQIVAGPE
jgi:hypothetical protein